MTLIGLPAGDSLTSTPVANGSPSKGAEVALVSLESSGGRGAKNRATTLRSLRAGGVQACAGYCFGLIREPKARWTTSFNAG